MIRAFFLLSLIVLGGCQASGLTTEAPTYDRVVQQFESTAFGSDFGRPTHVLMRWVSPQYLRFVGSNRQLVEGHKDDLNEVIKLIAKASGSRPLFDTQIATLVIAFTERSQYGDFLSHLPLPDIDHTLHSAASSRCYAQLLGSTQPFGAISHAVVLIDAQSSKTERRACLHQELIQVAGLPADACHYRPSVFCEADFPQTITETDLILLRTLYDPRLKPGMTREEAMPIARQIIRELWQE